MPLSNAPERGTYPVTIAFFDENGDPVTPTAATWSLLTSCEDIINSREDVAIGSLSTTAIILLSGADLAIIDANDNRQRHLTIKATYNSSLGTGLPLNQEATFFIEPIRGVP